MLVDSDAAKDRVTMDTQLQHDHHNLSCCVVLSLPVLCSREVTIGDDGKWIAKETVTTEEAASDLVQKPGYSESTVKLGEPALKSVENKHKVNYDLCIVPAQKDDQQDAHGFDIGSNISCTVTSKVEEFVESIERAPPKGAREAAEELYVDKVATVSTRTSQTVARTEGISREASEELRDIEFIDLSSTQTILPELAKPLSVKTNSVRNTQQSGGEEDLHGELHPDCQDPRQGHQHQTLLHVGEVAVAAETSVPVEESIDANAEEPPCDVERNLDLWRVPVGVVEVDDAVDFSIEAAMSKLYKKRHEVEVAIDDMERVATELPNVEIIGRNIGCTIKSGAVVADTEELMEIIEELVENSEGAPPRAAREAIKEPCVDEDATGSNRTSQTVASAAGEPEEFRDSESVNASSTNAKDLQNPDREAAWGGFRELVETNTFIELEAELVEVDASQHDMVGLPATMEVSLGSSVLISLPGKPETENFIRYKKVNSSQLTVHVLSSFLNRIAEEEKHLLMTKGAAVDTTDTVKGNKDVAQKKSIKWRLAIERVGEVPGGDLGNMLVDQDDVIKDMIIQTVEYQAQILADQVAKEEIDRGRGNCDKGVVTAAEVVNGLGRTLAKEEPVGGTDVFREAIKVLRVDSRDDELSNLSTALYQQQAVRESTIGKIDEEQVSVDGRDDALTNSTMVMDRLRAAGDATPGEFEENLEETLVHTEQELQHGFQVWQSDGGVRASHQQGAVVHDGHVFQHLQHLHWGGECVLHELQTGRGALGFGAHQDANNLGLSDQQHDAVTNNEVGELRDGEDQGEDSQVLSVLLQSIGPLVHGGCIQQVLISAMALLYGVRGAILVPLHDDGGNTQRHGDDPHHQHDQVSVIVRRVGEDHDDLLGGHHSKQDTQVGKDLHQQSLHSVPAGDYAAHIQRYGKGHGEHLDPLCQAGGGHHCSEDGLNSLPTLDVWVVHRVLHLLHQSRHCQASRIYKEMHSLIVNFGYNVNVSTMMFVNCSSPGARVLNINYSEEESQDWEKDNLREVNVLGQVEVVDHHDVEVQGVVGKVFVIPLQILKASLRDFINHYHEAIVSEVMLGNGVVESLPEFCGAAINADCQKGMLQLAVEKLGHGVNQLVDQGESKGTLLHHRSSGGRWRTSFRDFFIPSLRDFFTHSSVISASGKLLLI